MAWEEHLQHIANSARPLKASRLAGLASLPREGQQALAALWPSIEVQRRRQVVSQMVELAEDNVELNFDAIFLLCLEDEDAHVRATAIRGLWEYQEGDLIPRLVHLLAKDTDIEVRAQAALALGRYALMAEFGHLRPEEAQAVERALKSAVDNQAEAVEVRARAIEAAACLSQPWVHESIEGAYRSGSYRLRVSALHAMGISCEPSWLPVLLQELDSDEPELRYEAAGACGSLGLPEAVPHLIPLLDDEDSEVQAQAAAALGMIGGPEAKAHLLQRLRDPSPGLREAVRQALAELDFYEDPLAFYYRR